jgi:hypothetical protein
VVILTGHGSLDRASLGVAQQPVTVVYRLERRGSTNCIVRHQSPRGGVSNEAGWTEVVCANVIGFELSSAGAGGNDATTRVRIDGPAGRMVDEVIVVK